MSGWFDGVCYGIVIAAKPREYVYIKWLDTGKLVCYDCDNSEAMRRLSLVSGAPVL